MIDESSFESILPVIELSEKIDTINSTAEETEILYEQVANQTAEINHKYRRDSKIDLLQSLSDYGNVFESSPLIKRLWRAKQSKWNYIHNPITAKYRDNIEYKNRTFEMVEKRNDRMQNRKLKNCWICEAETETECAFVGHIKEGIDIL